MLKLNQNKRNNKAHQIISASTIHSVDARQLKTIKGGTFDGKGSDAASEG